MPELDSATKGAGPQTKRLIQDLERSIWRDLERPPLRDAPAPTAAPQSAVSVWAFGVALPLVVVGIEAATGMCGQAFFDPIPSLAHVLLALCVPAGNVLAALSIQGRLARASRLVSFANGIAIGVALVYTLLFLPLIPLGVIGLVFFGAGLLPLSPPLALAAGLAARRRVHRAILESGAPVRRRTGLGILVAMAIFVSLELPKAVTHLALPKAASSDRAERLRGQRWLRLVGNRDTLLRACYERGGSFDLLGVALALKEPVSTEAARRVFYETTGVPFNAVPPPRAAGLRVPFDADQGSSTVGGIVPGLSLAGSRLDGSIDADAALAYVEWTLEFRNDSPRPAEARAQVALPPQGVVSRLTLWIDGEEREAAFAARGAVQQAYQNVVRARRDPVLVTTAGPDRVLVQCFPVPPNGGVMKTRIGITAPLRLDALDRGSLRLPQLVERNFGVSPETSHAVWIESPRPLQSPQDGLSSETLSAGGQALRGRLREEALGEGTWVTASRSSRLLHAWTRDPLDPEARVVVQELEVQPVTPPDRVVIVVDTSRAMAPAALEVAAGLSKLPPTLAVSVLLAGDDVVALTDTERLRAFSFEGGRDNVPGLLRAWDLAAQVPRGAIVWVHGPQPILPVGTSELVQRWQRRPDGPRLYAVPALTGPNRILEQLDGFPSVESVPRRGPLQSDLAQFFSAWDGSGAHVVINRDNLARERFQGGDFKETSAHLARLWAHEQILRHLAEPARKGWSRAAALAAQNRLVTPASGAVVLETQAQYAQAGLQPVAPGEVPTVPEPETWMLLTIAATVLILTLMRRSAA